VIFTGVMTEHEFKEGHGAQYDRMQESGELAKLEAPEPSKRFSLVVKIFGMTAFSIGILLVLGIIAAELHQMLK
jgi:hypothetical protein